MLSSDVKLGAGVMVSRYADRVVQEIGAVGVNLNPVHRLITVTDLESLASAQGVDVASWFPSFVV